MTAPPFDGLEVLVEAAGPIGTPTPVVDEVRRLYGGDLALAAEVVYANFVTSIDGVAAIRSRPRSSADLSGGIAADRFVMGLLRATADAVVLGAGTLRAHPAGRWSAGEAFPPAAAAFASLRSASGATAGPRLVVVSGSGAIDLEHPGLDGALVLTTDRGAHRMRSTAPRSVEVAELAGDAEIDTHLVVADLRRRGFARLLTEGGPALMGRMLEAGVVDELFLTVSPRIAGRSDREARPGFADGVAFDPGRFPVVGLTSVRRWSDLLFLRYDLRRSAD
jgi:riboflavin biosynthesis pyrimidine reductase